MTFNAHTYSIEARVELFTIWMKAQKALDFMNPDRVNAMYVPVGSKGMARSLMHSLHRWRAAFRSQKKDNSLDSIVIGLVALEGEKPYGLKFQDAGHQFEIMGLECYDEKGNKL